MRGCFKAALAFGMIAVLAGPAMAQGRGGPGGGGPANLLGNASVQKELKMDEAQVEKAMALATETREKMTAVRTQLEGLEGQERTTKQMELAKPINQEVMKTAGTFLKPEQVKRLHQIQLQQLGANALVDADMAKKLNVTPEQAAKVKSILEDSQSEIREAFTSAGDDRQAAMAKVQTLRKEANAKAIALMTEEQKKMWAEMTGEPFVVVQQPRPAN